MSQQLSEEELRELIKSSSIRVSKDFLKNLDRLIAQRLEASVRIILGFSSDSYNGTWKVDHCNGRMSTISELISSEARERAKEIAHRAITPEIVEETLKECLPSVISEFKEKFREAVRSLVKNGVERITSNSFNAILTEVLPPLDEKERVEISKEPDVKPEYGDDIFEKIILKRIVEANAKGTQAS
jgi:hypothetical protein